MDEKEPVLTDKDQPAKEADKPNVLEEAYKNLRNRMFDKFKKRINTEEEDRHLQALVLGNRIVETFELFSVKGTSLNITFQSTNEEEEDFALSISSLNRQQVAMSPDTTKPLFDEERRFEYLMAMATLSINDTQFQPISLSDARAKVREERASTAERPEGFVPAGMRFIDELDDRVKEIKRRLPRGGMGVATRAFQVWLKYQAALLTGEKLENFFEAPKGTI